MSQDLKTTLGNQLYQLLPSIYRERDEDGDLAGFVDACGDLLDQVYAILDQRLKDSTPDECQAWIFPYFAQMLDVRLMSPSQDGQRRELENGVAWRQSKGSSSCVEGIAEAVGNTQFELQEGWQRVAMTAKLNQPLLSPEVYGYSKAVDEQHPTTRARHPGLPMGTVDLRITSRALQTEQHSPASKITTYGDKMVMWKQSGMKGTPCFPGSYEDVSRRTVDLRTPDSDRGHYHPKHVLLYQPLPNGFFPPGQTTVHVDEPETWPEHIEYSEWLEHDKTRDITIRHKSYRGLEEEPVKVVGRFTLDETAEDADELMYHFSNLYFVHTLTIRNGRVQLSRVAAFKVVVPSHEKVLPALEARDCLLRHMRVASGRAKLEYCTVLGVAIIEVLDASDCLFVCTLRKDVSGNLPPSAGCIRYSRIPESLVLPADRTSYCTREIPVFFNLNFGKPGCAVLHPATHEAIASGAEDGGEVGAYHHQYICLSREAVLDKLAEFLPLDITPVIIPDSRLNQLPAIEK